MKNTSRFSQLFIVIIITLLTLKASAQTPVPLQTTPSTGDEGDQTPSTVTIRPNPSNRGGIKPSALPTGGIQIIPHVAPNPNTSPSWQQARLNAMQGIEAGGVAIGSGPTAFLPIGQAGTVTSDVITLTSFPSWLGVENPSTPYNGEFGNQIYFGALIKIGDRTRMSDVSWELSSSDSGNLLGFRGNFSTNNYSVSRVGIDYGPDGIKGTADDIRRASGPGTALVDEIILFGIGNAFRASTIAEAQQIRGIVANNQPFSMQIEFTVLTRDGEVTASRVLPFYAEPISIFLTNDRNKSGILGVASGPPGVYVIEKSTTPKGPWVPQVSINKTEWGQTQGVVVAFDTKQTFFRARRQ